RGGLEPPAPRRAVPPPGRRAAEAPGAHPALRAGPGAAAPRRTRALGRGRLRLRLLRPGAPQPRLPRLRRQHPDGVPRRAHARRRWLRRLSARWHDRAVPFVHRLRVRFHECDPQGVVFNAHYFSYFDVALTEMWREAFGSYANVVAD